MQRKARDGKDVMVVNAPENNDDKPGPGRPGPGRKDGDSVGEHLHELLGMVVAYAKQETLDPLKSLVRFVAWGAAGALLIAVGGVLGALAVLRLLQGEAGVHLGGDLSWVPYSVAAVVAAAGAAAAASRITKGVR